MDEITRAMEALRNVDEGNPLGMSDDAPISTGHPSTSRINDERSSLQRGDAATESLEYIANERDDVSYLVGIANGESAHSLKYGKSR